MIVESNESTRFNEGIHELGLDKAFSEVKIISKHNPDGFMVDYKNGVCIIYYEYNSEFYRGIAYLNNCIKNNTKTFLINEKRKIKYCGNMIDVSRNAVLKVDAVKDIIRRTALMGHNILMLYMEDTYTLKDYPYFGYMRGAYTQEEIKEIDKYAKIFGVEVISCIQTLGHLKNIMRWSFTNKIKDTDAILLIDEPREFVAFAEFFRWLMFLLFERGTLVQFDYAVDKIVVRGKGGQTIGGETANGVQNKVFKETKHFQRGYACVPNPIIQIFN